MKFERLKELFRGRIGTVYCDHSRRIAFFRQPTTEEFSAMQLVDSHDKEQLRAANEDYTMGCFIASAPYPLTPSGALKEPHGSEDFEIVLEHRVASPTGAPIADDCEVEPWADRMIAIVGPAIVLSAWLGCVGQLGGGGAKRTRFF